MRRFFTEPQNIKGNIAEIFEDSRHIEKVLRMKKGDEIIVFDGTGFLYKSELLEIEQNRCLAKIKEKEFSSSEPKTKITLFQALPKAGKMETIIQKAVELGVFEIVPFVSTRCVVKINDKKAADEKVLRWNKISIEAAKQCGRGKIPEVKKIVTFEEAIDLILEKEIPIMAYEELGHEGDMGLKKILSEKKEANEIGILVGPEGGFEKSEADFALLKGVMGVGLGKRILRTETVSGAIIPVIMFQRDEF